MRILCVDDSTYNLFVIKELILQAEPNAVIDTALNGQIAFDKIFDHHQTSATFPVDRSSLYDIVLLDLHMPLLDGF